MQQNITLLHLTQAISPFLSNGRPTALEKTPRSESGFSPFCLFGLDTSARIRRNSQHIETSLVRSQRKVAMEPYKAQFIEFLVQAGVLTFGDFTTKSGRRTPYFVNTGNYRLGSQLDQLGQFYAQALTSHLGANFNNLYGPAYKGIPLAVAAAIALSRCHSHDVSVTYNRKEAKDHGEKGAFIGHKYQGDENVVIIEDVITAGTSVRESMALLQANGAPNVAAVIVSVDRMERGAGDLSAVQEVAQQFDVTVFTIVTVREIIAYLHNRPIAGKIHIDDTGKQRMETYLNEYGVNASVKE